MFKDIHVQHLENASTLSDSDLRKEYYRLRFNPEVAIIYVDELTLRQTLLQERIAKSSKSAAWASAWAAGLSLLIAITTLYFANCR